MLFCYPVTAADENWLHDSIMSIAENVLTHGVILSAEECLARFLAPKQGEIARKRALFAKISEFVDEAVRLSPQQRSDVLRCIDSQNQLPDLFGGVGQIVALPDGLRPEFLASAKDLFSTAFKLLSVLGIRDRQYQKVYETMPARVCAFCGIEPLDSPAPQIPREALDHFLALSRYPFAGVNLRNLAPMGHKCNSSHKLAKDVIVNDAGGRRKCFDPYGGQFAKVVLINSRPFLGQTKNLFVLPEWEIEFESPEEETATWDTIFDIRTRYQANVLDVEISYWVDHFAQWWARHQNNPPTDVAEVVSLLQNYIDVVIQEGFSNQTFLRRATFEMLMHQCVQPNTGQRVVDWIISLLNPDTGAIVAGA